VVGRLQPTQTRLPPFPAPLALLRAMARCEAAHNALKAGGAVEALAQELERHGEDNGPVR
jgi:hypothetical protein